MALASYVLMFAGSPQTFIGYSTAQDSLLLLFDILPAYVRHVRSQLEQRLMELSSFAVDLPHVGRPAPTPPRIRFRAASARFRIRHPRLCTRFGNAGSFD